MKYFLWLAYAALFIWLGIPTSSIAASNIQIIINGTQVESDVSPQLINGRTLVPLRVVSETMGMNVQWNNDSQKVEISNNQTNLELTINNPNVLKDGTILKLDQPAILFQDRALVPLRFIGDAMGATVQWDQTSQTVRVDQTPTTDTLHLQDIRQQDQNITLDMDTAISPKAFTLTSPDRIVLDLDNTLLSDSLKAKLTYKNAIGYLPVADSGSSNPLIKQVRVSQFSTSPLTARVVLDLSQPCQFTVNTSEGHVSVTLTSGQSTSSTNDSISSSTSPNHTKYIIVVDPGHGGKDTGAIGIQGNDEKDFTLSVAKLVVEELGKHQEFQVLMTRSGDTYPTLRDRVDLANQSNADLFLSIHANSFGPEAHGTEVFYTNDNSLDFASMVHQHLIAATGFPDRGIKTNNLFVTSNTNMPATLIEVGFLTNADEDAELLNTDFQKRVAKSVADAIYEYYTKFH